MQANLERKGPPTVTQPGQIPGVGSNAAAYALAFSITMGSTVAHENYNERMTIAAALLSASTDRTNAVWFEDKGDVRESWLGKAIAEMHAEIPDKAWEDVPDTSKMDFDSML